MQSPGGQAQVAQTCKTFTIVSKPMARVDRRMVGADWGREWAEPEKEEQNEMRRGEMLGGVDPAPTAHTGSYSHSSESPCPFLLVELGTCRILHAVFCVWLH